jgi:hypothetical protein
MQGNDAAFEARRCCFARYANVSGGAHGTLALDEERSSPPGLELVPAFGESERVQPTQYVREPPSQSGGMKGTEVTGG